MTEPNESFASVHRVPDSPAVGIGPSWKKADVVSRSGNPTCELPAIQLDPCDSIGTVVSDVDEFTRSWIGRIRRLIHRSSQLIERESLLAGAIARLDQQKSEWSKRTAAKEEALRDQSKKMTEAWLEVETLRRKAIQGARIAASTSPKSAIATIMTANGGPVVASNSIKSAAPVQGLVHPRPVIASPSGAESQAGDLLGSDSEGPVQQSTCDNVSNAGNRSSSNASLYSLGDSLNADGQSDGRHIVTQVQSVANTPILSDRISKQTVQACDPIALEHAEAATRQRIEEFKRMQRALRSNRNK